MKKVIVLVVLAVFGLSAMACGDASATNAAKSGSMKYAHISATGYTANYSALYDRQVEAALQQGLTNAGFVNDKDSGIRYNAVANWSEDKDFVTICITSEDSRITVRPERTMPGGCVNVSAKETGVDGAVGVALLPKAGEKIALMLKNQIEGKAMPTQPSEAPAPAKQPVKTEPATNSNTAANSKK